MAESSGSKSASRSAYLELLEEQQLVNSGYVFLDEKRMLLAAELLRQRAAYRGARERFLQSCQQAADELLVAAAESGLDGLQVSRAAEFPDVQPTVDQSAIMGQALIDARFDCGTECVAEQLPEAPASLLETIDAFREIIQVGVPFAALTTNLERLMHEYRRTERRVRALENVILPELHQEMANMQEELDLNEQEEIIRVHSTRQAR